MRDAFGHLKVLGFTTNTAELLAAASVHRDEGTIPTDDKESIRKFVSLAKKGRVWDREPKLRPPG